MKCSVQPDLFSHNASVIVRFTMDLVTHCAVKSCSEMTHRSRKNNSLLGRQQGTRASLCSWWKAAATHPEQQPETLISIRQMTAGEICITTKQPQTHRILYMHCRTNIYLCPSKSQTDRVQIKLLQHTFCYCSHLYTQTFSSFIVLLLFYFWKYLSLYTIFQSLKHIKILFKTLFLYKILIQLTSFIFFLLVLL